MMVHGYYSALAGIMSYYVGVSMLGVALQQAANSGAAQARSCSFYFHQLSDVPHTERPHMACRNSTREYSLSNPKFSTPAVGAAIGNAKLQHCIT
jgi:hypothetical protein